MTVRVLAIVAICALASGAGPLAAQAPPTGEPPCSGDRYREFDFWIGEWEVHDANGAYQGSNVIEPILGGCVLHEQWTGASGSNGKSYNIYDQRHDRWHQTWVSDTGLLLLIEGGIEDGVMVLRGSGKGLDGVVVEHIISWTPLDDGRVRQHWQTSRDGGESWSDAFVGLYRRVGGGGDAAAAEER